MYSLKIFNFLADYSEGHFSQNSLAEMKTDNNSNFQFTTETSLFTTNLPTDYINTTEYVMGLSSMDNNITIKNPLNAKIPLQNSEDKNLTMLVNNKTISHINIKEESNEILENVNIFPKIDFDHIELLDNVNLTSDNASSTLEQHIRNSVNSEIQSEQSLGTAIGEVLEDIEPEVRQTLAEDLIDVKYPQKRFLSGFSSEDGNEGNNTSPLNCLYFN